MPLGASGNMKLALQCPPLVLWERQDVEEKLDATATTEVNISSKFCPPCVSWHVLFAVNGLKWTAI